MRPDPEQIESARANKLRTTGGSHRLTLVKGAVDEADIDTRPPRPTLAHLPAGPGVWLAFDVELYPSQRDRVAARAAVSNRFEPTEPVVGEFPVELRGKLGSAVTRVPGELLDRVGLKTGNEVATIAVAPGALLVIDASTVVDRPVAVAEAIEAAHTALPAPADP